MGKNLYLEVNGEVFKVVYQRENHRFWVQVQKEGQKALCPLEVISLSPGVYLALHGNAPLLFTMRNQKGVWTLQTTRAIYRINVRRFQSQGNQQGVRNHSIVRAPMSGTVLMVKKEVGEQVSEGEGILILEAMKMQNEIQAPMDGVLKKIHVQPGQAVTHGMPLFEVVRPESSPQD